MPDWNSSGAGRFLVGVITLDDSYMKRKLLYAGDLAPKGYRFLVQAMDGTEAEALAYAKRAFGKDCVAKPGHVVANGVLMPQGWMLFCPGVAGKKVGGAK